MNNKNKYFLLLICCCLMALMAAGQTQSGYVKTKGRMSSNGQIIAGKRLAGAVVQVKGRSAVVTKSNGTFSFPVRASRFSIQEVKKQGYVILDPEILTKQYIVSDNPLIIVMDTPSQQLEDKLAAERTLRRALRQQLQQREDEIDSLRSQNAMSQEQYQQEVQRLYASQRKNELLIDDMAERYSQMDYDQMDEMEARISQCILEGRLTEADSLLKSSGDMATRIAAIHDEEKTEMVEEAELNRRRELLEKSKAGTLAAKERIARDCFLYSERFLVEHKNDSAAHYMEMRAQLDTTNIRWQNQAARVIHHYLADYRLALSYYKRALEQARLQYGEQSEQFMSSCINVGMMYSTLGDYARALEYDTLALNVGKSILTGPSSVMASAYSNIGSVYHHQKQYTEALGYYLKTAEMQEQITGYDLELAQTYNNLGVLYRDLGDGAHAMEYAQKGYEIRIKQLGEEHPDIATSYNTIAAIHRLQGDNETALEYYKKALAIRERMLGKWHTETANSYNNLGFLSTATGDYDQAMEYYKKALAVIEKTLSPKHQTAGLLHYNIAEVYSLKKDYAHALEQYEMALGIFKAALGENHKNVLTIEKMIESTKEKMQH